MALCFQLDTQDKIILQWKTGESATMHILVVHAMVIILSYGLPKGGWRASLCCLSLGLSLPLPPLCLSSLPHSLSLCLSLCISLCILFFLFVFMYWYID